METRAEMQRGVPLRGGLRSTAMRVAMEVAAELPGGRIPLTPGISATLKCAKIE